MLDIRLSLEELHEFQSDLTFAGIEINKSIYNNKTGIHEFEKP